jgi:hypothetical protein
MSTLFLEAEHSPRRVFVWARDWPGWCRSGKTEKEAIETLLATRERYRRVTDRAGLKLPGAGPVEVAATVEGGGGTAFGVPSVITDHDRRPARPAETERLARLVAAAWEEFDHIAAAAPEELRKGPRGGGRDTSAIIAHVLEADRAYAREIGLKTPTIDPADTAAVEALRTLVLDSLRPPTDGRPLAGRKWTTRYAARRIAWHALDHAWEIEDRTLPVPT